MKGEIKISKKLNHLEYTAELKKKQPRKRTYLLYLAFAIASIWFMFKSSVFLEKDFYFSELTFALWTLIPFLTSWLLIKALEKCPHSITKERKIRLKLLRIIQGHKYYDSEDEKHITASLVIKFSIYDEQLILRIFPDGEKYTFKVNDLGKIFESKFNMTVVSVQNDAPNHTTFILENTTDNFIDASKFFGGKYE